MSSANPLRTGLAALCCLPLLLACNPPGDPPAPSAAACDPTTNTPRFNAAQFNAVGIPAAWAAVEGKWRDQGAGFPEILVVDDGFFDHADHRMRPDLLPGFKSQTSEGNLAAGLGGHGTGVAALIGAIRGNATGIDGVAGPRCRPSDATGDFPGTIRLFPARATAGLIPNAPGMSPINLAAAIDHYVDRPRLRIINISQNLIELEDDPNSTSAIEVSLKRAAQKGILVITGAGNTRATWETRGTANWLAAYDNLIVVGGLNTDGTGLWIDGDDEGTATGSAIDLWAPAEGYKTIQHTRDSAADQAARLSGTSYATPVVAGVAAMMLNVNPALSPRQIRLILQRTADRITVDGKTLLRMNAGRAMQMATRPPA